jgi:Spy/CpxP family protein refolding chaperone
MPKPAIFTLGVVLATVLTVTPDVSAQRFKWWQDEAVQKRFNLTREQAKRIDEIFNNSLPDLRHAKEELDRLEHDLVPLADGSNDDATLKQQVDRVETARAELNKARSLMLLRIRRVLTPDQRVKVEAWQHEREGSQSDHHH